MANLILAGADSIDTVLSMMKEYYEFDGIAWEPEAARMALQDLIQNRSYGLVWLIKCENEVAGYLVLTFGFSLEYHGRYAFIDELFIKKERRRRGIGAEALELAVREAKLLQINALHLEVEFQNNTAKEFYEQRGFKAHDRILMSKWLAPFG